MESYCRFLASSSWIEYLVMCVRGRYNAHWKRITCELICMWVSVCVCVDDGMKLIVWENVGVVCLLDLLHNSIVTQRKNSKMHTGCRQTKEDAKTKKKIEHETGKREKSSTPKRKVLQFIFNEPNYYNGYGMGAMRCAQISTRSLPSNNNTHTHTIPITTTNCEGGLMGVVSLSSCRIRFGTHRVC